MQLRGCSFPWFEMHYRFSGVTGFCCYHYDMPHEGQPIKNIWNSDYFKNTRAEIAKNEPKGTRCEICPWIKFNNITPYLTIPDYIQGARRSNWEQALRHYRAGDTHIESLPIKYFLFFGLACNLRCKMCDHPLRFMDGETSVVDPTGLLADPQALQQAGEVGIIGGEPFLIKEAAHFIRTVAARPDMRDLLLSIYTNGILLNNFLDDITPMPNLTLVLSIDSYGKRYEEIRKRATWQRLEENTQGFVKRGRELGKNWKVKVVVTVMKDGILGYPELMQWIDKQGIDVHFGAVESHFEGARQENIFANAGLLRSEPGWEKALEKSIGILNDTGRQTAANQLKLFYNDLTARYGEWEKIASRSSRIARANDWKNIGALSDSVLLKTLQYNVYEGPVQKTLSMGKYAIEFTPSTKRDHLSLPFLEIGQPVGGERYARITVAWDKNVPPENRLTFETQDQRCVNLPPTAEADEAAEGEKVYYYRLPEISEQLRLIFISTNAQQKALPREVRLESYATAMEMAG